MEDSFTSPVFRKQALEYYVQSRTKAVLPRLAQPPVFLLLWILLCLAGLALTVSWFGRVPVYASGFGVVIQHTSTTSVGGGIQQYGGAMHRISGQEEPNAMALVFVPVVPTHPFSLHAGVSVQLQMGTQRQLFTTIVAEVEPGIFSPAEIQQRYAPGNGISALITGPSLVVLIDLSPSFASQFYMGSLIHAQIQAGSTSVFSSLFGSAQLFGE